MKGSFMRSLGRVSAFICCREATPRPHHRSTALHGSPSLAEQLNSRYQTPNDSSTSSSSPTEATTAAANPLLDPKHKMELINRLLATEWKFVSVWFEEQMRNTVEPLLQDVVKNYTRNSVTLKLGDTCDLGKQPLQLEDIKTETYKEAMPDGGEDIENMKIVGNLDYHGNGIVRLEVLPTVGVGVKGHVQMTGLKLKGVVVIELVKLTQAPPWFSGVRIFFPNRPEIDITMYSSLSGMDVNWDFIKTNIIKALDEKVLTRQAVLPNRISIGLPQRIEDFSLRHPRPQGVLRLILLRAESPPKKENEPEQAEHAEITLGDLSLKKTVWGEDEFEDLLITDLDTQSIRITVKGFFQKSWMGWKKEDFLVGRAQIPVAELAMNNKAVKPSGMKYDLVSESGYTISGASVCLRAQYRPFAPATDIKDDVESLDSLASGSSWSIGPVKEDTTARWLLAADLLYVSGMPLCDNGIEHWISFTVSGHADAPETRFTWVAPAAGPYESGKKDVNSLGLDAEILNDTDRAELGRKMWRKRVKLGDAATEAERNGASLVDVVWGCPLKFMIEKVQDVKVKISVWRPAYGKLRPTDYESAKLNCVLLGSAEETLTVEGLRQRMTLDSHSLLTGGISSLATIKFRLRACPLLPPPAAAPKMDVSFTTQVAEFLRPRINSFAPKNVSFATTGKLSVKDGEEEEDEPVISESKEDAPEIKEPTSQSWYSRLPWSAKPTPATTVPEPSSESPRSEGMPEIEPCPEPENSVSLEALSERADNDSKSPVPRVVAPSVFERFRTWRSTPKVSEAGPNMQAPTTPSGDDEASIPAIPEHISLDAPALSECSSPESPENAADSQDAKDEEPPSVKAGEPGRWRMLSFWSTKSQDKTEDPQSFEQDVQPDAEETPMAQLPTIQQFCATPQSEPRDTTPQSEPRDRFCSAVEMEIDLSEEHEHEKLTPIMSAAASTIEDTPSPERKTFSPESSGRIPRVRSDPQLTMPDFEWNRAISAPASSAMTMSDFAVELAEKQDSTTSAEGTSQNEPARRWRFAGGLFGRGARAQCVHPTGTFSAPSSPIGAPTQEPLEADMPIDLSLDLEMPNTAMSWETFSTPPSLPRFTHKEEVEEVMSATQKSFQECEIALKAADGDTKLAADSLASWMMTEEEVERLEYTWSAERSGVLGEDLSEEVLDQIREHAEVVSTCGAEGSYLSVSKSISALNTGCLVVTGGVCVVFSQEKGSYYVVWRSDKEAAVAQEIKELARAPEVSLHEPAQPMFEGICEPATASELIVTPPVSGLVDIQEFIIKPPVPTFTGEVEDDDQWPTQSFNSANSSVSPVRREQLEDVEESEEKANEEADEEANEDGSATGEPTLKARPKHAHSQSPQRAWSSLLCQSRNPSARSDSRSPTRKKGPAPASSVVTTSQSAPDPVSAHTPLDHTLTVELNEPM